MYVLVTLKKCSIILGSIQTALSGSFDWKFFSWKWVLCRSLHDTLIHTLILHVLFRIDHFRLLETNIHRFSHLWFSRHNYFDVETASNLKWLIEICVTCHRETKEMVQSYEDEISWFSNNFLCHFQAEKFSFLLFWSISDWNWSSIPCKMLLETSCRILLSEIEICDEFKCDVISSPFQSKSIKRSQVKHIHQLCHNIASYHEVHGHIFDFCLCFISFNSTWSHLRSV